MHSVKAICILVYRPDQLSGLFNCPLLLIERAVPLKTAAQLVSMVATSPPTSGGLIFRPHTHEDVNEAEHRLLKSLTLLQLGNMLRVAVTTRK